MQIVPFTHEHIPQAQALALAEVNEARAALPLLPPVDAVPGLSWFADAQNGVAALEDGALVGYLCGCPPFEKAFGGESVGTFSPLQAHAAVRERRAELYPRLYSAAARLWVDKGITTHVIALYAHDHAAQNAFYTFGFGMRCGDAIRPMTPPEAPVPAGLSFAEVPVAEFPALRPLRLALNRHLGESPCFLRRDETDVTAWLDRVESGDRRTFAARDAQGRVLAYIDITDEGENFITAAEGMANINGAYCVPEARGTGVTTALLAEVIRRLRAEGFALLGVDYETINPAALHYWRKHFTPYTASVTRRVEESALRKP